MCTAVSVPFPFGSFAPTRCSKSVHHGWRWLRTLSPSFGSSAIELLGSRPLWCGVLCPSRPAATRGGCCSGVKKAEETFLDLNKGCKLIKALFFSSMKSVALLLLKIKSIYWLFFSVQYWAHCRKNFWTNHSIVCVVSKLDRYYLTCRRTCSYEIKWQKHLEVWSVVQ